MNRYCLRFRWWQQYRQSHASSSLKQQFTFNRNVFTIIAGKLITFNFLYWFFSKKCFVAEEKVMAWYWQLYCSVTENYNLRPLSTSFKKFLKLSLRVFFGKNGHFLCSLTKNRWKPCNGNAFSDFYQPKCPLVISNLPKESEGKLKG